MTMPMAVRLLAYIASTVSTVARSAVPAPASDPELEALRVTAYATLALVVATVILAAVAAFQDRIRNWLFHPRLALELHVNRPDCQKTPLSTQGGSVDSYYYRLRVLNLGTATAAGVEVLLAGLEEWRDGQFRPCAWFLPMNLTWTHFGGAVMPHISQGMMRHCEIGRVVDPSKRHSVPEDDLASHAGRALFKLLLLVQPNTRTDVLVPSRYRLRLVVAAKNSGPTRWTISLNLNGDWHADEQTMLRDGPRLELFST